MIDVKVKRLSDTAILPTYYSKSCVLNVTAIIV